MMRTPILLLLFSFNLLAEVPSLAPVARELASPVTEYPANAVLAVGGALTLTFAVVRYQTGDDVQSFAYREKPLGNTSGWGEVIGYGIPNALYFGWWYVDHQRKKDAGSRARASLMLKTTLYSMVTTNVLKYTVGETRPAGDEDVSFPSGHATAAFAFATVVATEHGLPWAIPSYALASFIAYSRLNDNRHYTHDVIAGATIGTAFGLGLASLQDEAEKSDETSVFVPFYSGSTIGIAWARTFD